MRKMTFLLILVAMTMTFMACGSCKKQANDSSAKVENVEQTATEDGATSRIPKLSDTYGTWKLTKVLDIDVKVDATMTFNKNGQFSAKVCNAISGKFVQRERRPDALCFEYLRSTRMMGGYEEMKVEDALNQQLYNVRTFYVKGDELQLADENDNIVITARRK